MPGIDGCLTRIMEIPGARSVTLVDGASGLAVASAGHGQPVDQHQGAADAAEVVRTVVASPALGVPETGDAVEEIIICGTRGFHLLTLIDGAFDGQLFVHLLLDRDKGNLALARHRLQRVVGELSGAEDGR